MTLSFRQLSNLLLGLLPIFSWVEAGGGGSSRYVNTGSYTGPRRQNFSVYEPLMDHIFKGYNNLAIPICKSNESLHMMIDMWLYQLFDLDEPKQELTLDVWIDLNWIDCSISWDPWKFSGISEVVVPAQEVWHPDIFAYQGLHGNYEEGLFIFRESKVKINHQGVIQLGAQLLLKTFCRVNIANFPYDDQTCPITFSAWNKDLTVFNMTKKPSHGEEGTDHTFSSASNGEWAVMGLKASDSFQTFHVGSSETETERFSEVTFTLHLKRKPRFIQVYLMFPCMLLLWVASITFLLPVSCGEKVSLVSTVLLSLVVFLLVVAGYVPHSSDSVPIIGKFYFASIGLVAVAMLMTTVVLNVSHKDPGLFMPACLQRFLHSGFANFFCLSFPKQSRTQQYSMIRSAASEEPRFGPPSKAPSEPPCQIANQWEHLGLVLDRVFLLVYLVMCLINTLYMVSLG